MESIITRMNCNRNFELHYVELQSICTKLIDSTKNREALLISVNNDNDNITYCGRIINGKTKSFAGTLFAAARFITERVDPIGYL